MTHSSRDGYKATALGGLTYSAHYEMVIASPIKRVWQHMLNYHDWNPDHKGARVERLAGEPNQEGETILEYKKMPEGYAPPIIIETVKVLPERQIVWALYAPESGASKGIGFVDFSLTDRGGQTGFLYNCYGWMSHDTYGSDRASLDRIIVEQTARLLPELKAYVESAPGDRD